VGYFQYPLEGYTEVHAVVSTALTYTYHGVRSFEQLMLSKFIPDEFVRQLRKLRFRFDFTYIPGPMPLMGKKDAY